MFFLNSFYHCSNDIYPQVDTYMFCSHCLQLLSFVLSSLFRVNSSYLFRHSNKSTLSKINFLISQPKHMLWDGSFEHPKYMLKLMDKKIFTILHSKFWLISRPMLLSTVILLQEWPFVKVDAYLLCSHCLAVGIEKPYLWRGEVLDIKNPKGIYHLQCPFSDADSLIPACFVYPIDPGNTLTTGLDKKNST